MDRKLIELLICPVTRGPLQVDSERSALISKSAKLVYPIRDGIPILLEQEAIDLHTWEQQEAPSYDAATAKNEAKPVDEAAAPDTDLQQKPSSDSRLDMH